MIGGEDSPHKGWHSRGYLPHRDESGLLQFVTFRLADAVPSELILRWREELWMASSLSQDEREAKLIGRIERYSDCGYGKCWLKKPEIAALVRDSFLHFDGRRYRLMCWVIMPNHVHLIIETMEGYPVGDLVRGWKTWTARTANALLGRAGSFWCCDYFDRYQRDQTHFAATRHYIRENPVKAGLAASA